MFRSVRMAVSVLTMTLVLSMLALAQDKDDYYRQGNAAQAQQYGYNNGFRDGAERGQHEGREQDPYDYQTPDWRQATRGYENWMGPMVLYQRGYQNGYRNGFQSAFESTSRPWGDRNGDRDGDGDAYQQYGSRGGYYDGRGIAERWGYQDGADQARSDLARGKHYNSNPRGKYDDRDRGYRHEFGSKGAYKAEYTQAFQRGYDDVMNQRY